VLVIFAARNTEITREDAGPVATQYAAVRLATWLCVVVQTTKGVSCVLLSAQDCTRHPEDNT